MTKHQTFEKFVTEMEITIPIFTGEDDGGLSFLDQPDAWAAATVGEVNAAKQRALQIAGTITDEQTKGKKLAGLVAAVARKNGDEDVVHVAEMVLGDREYIIADMVGGLHHDQT